MTPEMITDWVGRHTGDRASCVIVSDYQWIFITGDAVDCDRLWRSRREIRPFQVTFKTTDQFLYASDALVHAQ